MMSKKQKRVFWPALIILAIAGSAFVFAKARSSPATVNSAVTSPSHLDTGETVSPAAADKALDSTIPQGSQGPVQMIRFTVYDAGIFPKEARASRGWVAIHLQDMSGVSSGLVVLNESRQTLGQIVLDQRHWRANGRLHLEPGHYRIFDATQPRNWASLIVEQ